MGSRCYHFDKSYRFGKRKSNGYNKIYSKCIDKYGYPVCVESGISCRYTKWIDNYHNHNWRVRELTGKSYSSYLKYNGEFIRYPRKCILHPFVKEGEKGLW